jgi:mycofactocin precursor
MPRQHSLVGAHRGTLIHMDTENNPTPVAESEQAAESTVTEELLVEEISIDGMCGVY